MSGHSKWSTIKRQKAVTDGRRAKVWARITRDMMVAAREGVADPSMNARLALCVEKAKAANMPKDNIDRAIKRGSGEIAGADYEELSYEGYGPGGVAVFVEALTDNPNRTVADLRVFFSRAGGALGNSGSVAFMFDRKSVFEIAQTDLPTGMGEDDLFLLAADAGAEDLEPDGEGGFVVTAPVDAFGAVLSALRGANVEPTDATLRRFPTTATAADPDATDKVHAMLDKIDDHPDIQAVYSTLADES